jgi:hypothetical protein
MKNYLENLIKIKRAFKVVYKEFNGNERRSAIIDGKYRLEYPEGKHVIAPKESIGIFCFKEKKNAEYFIESSHLSYMDIIEVLYHCRAKKIKWRLSTVYFDDGNPTLNFKKLNKLNNGDAVILNNENAIFEVPKGTICIHKIFCLT